MIISGCRGSARAWSNSCVRGSSLGIRSPGSKRAGRRRHHGRVNWSVNVAGDGNNGYAPSERRDSLFSPSSGHGSLTEDVRCLFKVQPRTPNPPRTDTSPPLHPPPLPSLPCLSCQPGSCVDESRSKRTHTDEDEDEDKGQGISAGAQEGRAAEGGPTSGGNSAQAQ